VSPKRRYLGLTFGSRERKQEKVSALELYASAGHFGMT
jgi:hypothetical protein